MKTIPSTVTRTGAIARGQLNRVYQGRSTPCLIFGNAKDAPRHFPHSGYGVSLLDNDMLYFNAYFKE
jgi:hypothetical protein